MKAGSKALRCIVACVLILSMVPAVSFAEEGILAEETVNAGVQPVAEEGIEEAPLQDEAPVMLAAEETPESDIQPLSDVQEGPQVLEEGDFGEENALHWVYRDDASLTITGTGAIPEYAKEGGQPWNAYLRSVEALTIEEGVTSIGAYSFYEADYLGVGAILLPESLLTIGDHAFYGCDALRSIEFLESVEVIGSYVFAQCRALKKVVVPDSVVAIGARSFEGCYRIEECKLSEGMKTISEGLFSLSSSVGVKMSITLPSSLESIEAEGFFGCIFSDLDLPGTLSTIGSKAFWSGKVKNDLHVPGSIRSVGSEAFSIFRIEGDLSFDEGVAPVVFNALIGYGASASEVWVAHHITVPASMGWTTSFRNGGARDGYEVAPGSDCYSAVDGVLYSKGSGNQYESTRAVLVSCPSSMSGELTVPEGVRSISSGALSKLFEVVDLPASLERFDSGVFSEYRLQSVHVDDDNQQFSSIDGILFDKAVSKVIRAPKDHVFDGDYVLPDTVSVLEAAAFEECRNLVSIRIPEGVTKLPNDFIKNCRKLIAVYLPSTLKRIEMWNFWQSYIPYDHSGTNVFFGGTEEELAAITMHDAGNNAYDRARFYCDVKWHGVTDDGLMWYADNSKTLHIITDERADDPTTSMKDRAAGESPWRQHADLFESVVTAPEITSVGEHAFSDCENIKSVTLSWGIARVGASAFADCPNLVEVDCLGSPFAVVAAEDQGASFDVAHAVLLCKPNIAAWFDAPAYDAQAKRWNGYMLDSGEMPDLPQISTVVVEDDAGAQVHEAAITGVGEDYQHYTCNDQDLCLRVLADDGSDITDKVDIQISSPQRSNALVTNQGGGFGANMLVNLNRTRSLDVSFDDISNTLRIGCCSPEGVHKVIISPKEYESAGDAVTYEINVTRAPERIFHALFLEQETARGLAGREKTDSAPYRDRFEISSQYVEVISSKVQARAIDALSQEDITDELECLGVSFPTEAPGVVQVDRMSKPRDCELVFSDPTGKVSGAFTLGLALKRQEALLNKPYSLTLSQGSTEIEVDADAESTWSSTPYRVRTLDAYDDPCWPDLGWKIESQGGVDASSQFVVDEQGYVQVTSAAKGLINGDSSGPLKISSSAPGRVMTKVSNELEFVLKLKQPDPAPVTHVATFKVGDEVIGQVTFAEGDASLETPAMPPKANYLGIWKMEDGTVWDDFDLASAKTDLTVIGEYAPLNPDEVSDITTSGNAEYEDGAVTVNLRASASSRNVRVESSSTKPVDVVLVCDQSGSMGKELGSTTKVEALKKCARAFADSLHENAKKTGADHRIALVGFAYANDRNGRSNNTGLLATNASSTLKKYSALKNADYAQALMPISANGQLNGKVAQGIAAIKPDGATAADLGLEMAKSIFSCNPVGQGTTAGDRERIVIFLTDGTPTSWGTTSGESGKVSATAAAAIKQANSIKQGQGARIYSVGVEGKADAAAGDLYGSKGWKTERGETLFDFNRFLHLVSSNYPAATAMSNKGPGSQSDGYYMPVTDVSALDDIFTTILYTTVYTVEAFERATIRYEVPAGLSLTLKQEEKMRLELESQGIASDDVSVVREGSKTTITFSNVPVQRVLTNGVPEYVAAVSFQLSAEAGVVGDVGMGSFEADCMGDVSTGIIASVSIPQDRCAVVFLLDGQPYEIRDLKEGDLIEIPDTDLARWMSLEKLTDEQRRASGTSVVFETTSLSRTYAITWLVEGAERKENLAPGAKVVVPDVSDLIPEGCELAGWVPAPPLSMPSEDVTCTAVITKSHEHAFTASSYKTGSCIEGMIVHDVCACGEELTSQEEAKSAHAFATVLSSDGEYANATKKLVCKECGYSVEKDMEYEAAAEDDQVTVLDLTKLESDVAKPGESADDIEIQYFMDADDGEEYTVTRIDEDDTRTEYGSFVRDGYLWFYPDHFSIYVVGAKDASGASMAANVDYAESLERLQRAAADIPAVTDPPTEGDGLGDDGSGDGDDGNAGGGGDGGSDGAGIGGGSVGGSVNGSEGGMEDEGEGGRVDAQPEREVTRVGTEAHDNELAQTGDDAMARVVAFGVGAAAALVLFVAAFRRLRSQKRS